MNPSKLKQCPMNKNLVDGELTLLDNGLGLVVNFNELYKQLTK